MENSPLRKGALRGSWFGGMSALFLICGEIPELSFFLFLDRIQVSFTLRGKQGGFPGRFPIVSGKGPDCVPDPSGPECTQSRASPFASDVAPLTRESQGNFCSGRSLAIFDRREISATSRFDKITTRYEYWEVLSPPSVCFNREFPYIFVYCFSCRYLVELGLRQLGLPAPKNHACILEPRV